MYRILVRKPEAKRQLGKPRCTWVDNKMGLKEVWHEDVGWIYVALDRVQLQFVVNTPMDFHLS